MRVWLLALWIGSACAARCSYVSTWAEVPNTQYRSSHWQQVSWPYGCRDLCENDEFCRCYAAKDDGVCVVARWGGCINFRADNSFDDWRWRNGVCDPVATTTTSSTTATISTSSSTSLTVTSSSSSTSSSSVSSSTSSTRSSSSSTSRTTSSSSSSSSTSRSTSSSSTSTSSASSSTSSSSSSTTTSSSSSSSSSSTSRSFTTTTTSSSTVSSSSTSSTSSTSTSSSSSSHSSSSTSSRSSSSSTSSTSSLSTSTSSASSSTSTSRTVSTVTETATTPTTSSTSPTSTSSSSASSTSTSFTWTSTSWEPTTTRTSSSTSASSTSTSSTSTPAGPGTTPARVSEEERVQELLAAVQQVEAKALSGLAGSNETLSTVSSAVSVTAAAKLSTLLSEMRLPPAGGNVSGDEPEAPSVVVVPVEGTEVEVAVPVTVLESVETRESEVVVMVVTVFEEEEAGAGPAAMADALASEGEAPRASAVVNIDFVALLGNRSRSLEVGGLEQAIEFSLPTNYTANTRCAFWQEEKGVWSQEGVSVSERSVPGGLLWCLTTHLSLFAAIWQAFLVTLGCSQVSLLSLEAVRNIIKGNWYSFAGTLAIWTLLASFLLLYLLAAWLDGRDHWRTEFFLMPSKETPEERALKLVHADDLSFAPEATATETLRISLRGRLSVMSAHSQGADFGPVASTGTAVSAASTVSSGQDAGKAESSYQCLTGCVAIVNYTMGNSAVRDAIQDIVTAWCKQLGIIQGVCEGIWQVVSFGPASLSTASVSSAKLVFACRRALQSIAILSAQKQAGARLCLSSDMVVHILEDPDLYSLLARFKDREPVSRHDVYVEETGEAAWAQLHERVTEQVLEELDLQPRRSVCSMTLTLFMVYNPFCEVLVFDPFYDRKLRTFLFLVDQALTLMVMCFFFEASGERSKKGKSSGGGGCGDSSHAELMEMSGYRIGRFMAIALVSAGLSTIPIFFLESLQTRGMVRTKHKGCPKWNRQLRIWMTQDRMIYGVGGILLLFALFFVNLFLANGSAQDHHDWLVGISLVLLQDWLALPFSVALALPLTSKAMMLFLRVRGRLDYAALVKEQRVAFYRKTNAMLPVMGV